jgi:hypothetical protein
MSKNENKNGTSHTVSNIAIFITVCGVLLGAVIAIQRHGTTEKAEYPVSVGTPSNNSDLGLPGRATSLPDPCGLDVVECENEKRARITEYGWTGYRMANGKYPEIGYVAVSDRSIPLGTKIILRGQEYEVGDRTALWVHEKFGFTVDVYSQNPSGRSYENIQILR